MSDQAPLTRWWEVGDVVAQAGAPHLEIWCPKCHTFPVFHNGNYFCGGFDGGDCDWALAHPARSKRDRAICDLIGIDYS
jgi:hypothetical protein